MPFYQPLAILSVFERAIAGKDIATGLRAVRGNYTTVGTRESLYREGNATVVWDVLPTDSTYNTTTDEPNPVNGTVAKRGLEGKQAKGKKRKAFKLFQALKSDA